MNYTDEQLKCALAKMLPATIVFENQGWATLRWGNGVAVRNTELLYLCWVAEEEIFRGKSFEYMDALDSITFFNDSLYTHATWQQKVIALARAKEMEIV